MQIIKRDGRLVEFDSKKIIKAISKAFKEVKIEECDIPEIIAEEIEKDYTKIKTVEDIQNDIERKLMRYEPTVARSYIRYRYKRELVRESNTTDKEILELLDGESEYWQDENSNKNATTVNVQRDYIAGITSVDISKRFLLPSDIIKAHNEGIIHFHDMDYFAQKTLSNCSLINLEDMLQNGTVINGITIEKPHRLLTAMTIATQIITAVSSAQYGGTSISLTHLAPFVRDSYNRIKEDVTQELSELYEYDLYSGYQTLLDNTIEKITMERLKKEIKDAVQTFNYQINSMTNTNGQAPFLSVFMYLNEDKEYKKEIALLIEEFLRQRIQGMKNEVGVYVTPAFPKLLYVLEEDNIREDGEYWYLTELAAECTAKRLVPDYISEKVMKEVKVDSNGEGQCFPCMGCRSFLLPYVDERTNKPKYYGRFNQGVVTINLADIAFSSKGNLDKFWELFDERTELCHKALRLRHERLKGIKSDVAPILWQHGAFARLSKGEKIDKLLYNNYSTLSLGYAALYECVKYMTHKSHTDRAEGTEFGLQIMKALNSKCAEWRFKENIGYSLYGSPIESTTYKFAKCLKKRFGKDIFEKLDGKDRNYITNSYHVPVFEEIDPFEKLNLESVYQKLSQGGAISYIECADMTKNIKAELEVIKYIYDNMMYAELNTKSDYCQVCGYDGEIKIIDKDNKLIWECPNCGNQDKNKLNVARRTCGYIGSQFWNQGRTQEIKERVVHLDNLNL